MVFVKKSTFFSYVFFSKETQKETFIDILNKKEPFLALKSEVLKTVKKNRDFSKGLVLAFFQKIDLFFIFFLLLKESQEKTFFDILNRKQCFLDQTTKVLKKSKKSKLCKGDSPWFFPKKSTFFSYVFLLAKKKQKETIFDILGRKEYFLDLKSKLLKTSKTIDILQRG